mmetsp:Transcript_145111/g.253180  ORF Transcript_145111/g.253180 Transcript_145111/m.253180 type:complete len:227 (-) Transcript_145111:766-1446(-)
MLAVEEAASPPAAEAAEEPLCWVQVAPRAQVAEAYLLAWVLESSAELPEGRSPATPAPPSWVRMAAAAAPALAAAAAPTWAAAACPPWAEVASPLIYVDRASGNHSSCAWIGFACRGVHLIGYGGANASASPVEVPFCQDLLRAAGARGHGHRVRRLSAAPRHGRVSSNGSASGCASVSSGFGYAWAHHHSCCVCACGSDPCGAFDPRLLAPMLTVLVALVPPEHS